MNRRAFLTRPLKAETMPEPDAEPSAPLVSVAEAGYPRDYSRHSLVLVQNARAWLGRDELGFYAVDAACPHLGCMVRPDHGGFACPCHFSTFGASGEVTSGPARRALRYLMVDVDITGKLIIRRDRVVSADDRLIA